jgi:tripartite-type tricarboxylate transporter receptor subunit TctC
MMNRRRFSAQLAGLAALAAPPVWAQANPGSLPGNWPNRPVRMVVAGAAGSGTDIAARLVSDLLARRFGQPFVVDNRAGANGMIATEFAAKQAGDGYTLLVTYAAAHVVNPVMMKLNYDPVKDLLPVAQIGSGGNFLIVGPNFPANDLNEFIAHVRSRPEDELSYGTWGNGSGGHLSMEAIKQHAGLKIKHIPYRSSAAANQDLVAGIIPIAFSAVATAQGLMQGGKVKAIAISGPIRAPVAPNVRTMTEQGVPFDAAAWYGLMAPAGTPSAIIQAINAEINRLILAPDMAETWRKIGLSDMPVKTPAEFASTIQQDIRVFGDIVRKGNIKAE